MLINKLPPLPKKVKLHLNSTDMVSIEKDATEKELIRIAKYYKREYDDKVRAKIVRHPNVTPKVLDYLATTNPEHFDGTLDLIIQHPLTSLKTLEKLWGKGNTNHYVYFYSQYDYGYFFLWKGLNHSEPSTREYAEWFLEYRMKFYDHNRQSYKDFIIKMLHKSGFNDITAELPLPWLEAFYQETVKR